jgi:hypothetical protein
MFLLFLRAGGKSGINFCKIRNVPLGISKKCAVCSSMCKLLLRFLSIGKNNFFRGLIRPPSG